MIMYWEGTVVADGLVGNGPLGFELPENTQSHLAIKYASGHESITRNECAMVSWVGVVPCIGYSSTVYGWMLDTDPRLTFVRSMEYRLNLKFGVYVGPNAATGTYSVPELSFVLDSSNRYLMMKAGTVEVIPPLECNIDIPPKIEFLKVNIWDLEGNIPGTPGGKLGDVLGVVEGNFAINCTGDINSRASATLTLNGTSGNLSEDLILTMDRTGEVAPASVRVTIKDLKPPCSSGVSWGPVAGNPNANVVKLDDLVPGNKQVPYRFSLCSTGQGFKGGAASGSATIKFDWE
ncbi:hypothetical protein [Moellerella wisconsensis]|uniref:hypothetical protein n=1 Tax=Moellerella wisconsensis TaxID=158849 RepID=UPI003076573E